MIISNMPKTFWIPVPKEITGLAGFCFIFLGFCLFINRGLGGVLGVNHQCNSSSANFSISLAKKFMVL